MKITIYKTKKLVHEKNLDKSQNQNNEILTAFIVDMGVLKQKMKKFGFKVNYSDYIELRIKYRNNRFLVDDFFDKYLI